MEFHLEGESIESEESEITTRNLVPEGFINHSILGQVFKCKGNRNSKAVITKELNPKEYKFKVKSHLENGDTLKAEGIYILSKMIRKPKKKLINESGRHKAQFYKFKKFTFAEIEIPLENVINSMRKRGLLKG